VVRLLTIKTTHDVDFLSNAINRKGFVVESTGVPQLTVPKLEELELFYPKTPNEEFAIGKLLVNIDSLITLHQCKSLENKKILSLRDDFFLLYI
ncbi:MAG: type I restriction endonuclease subunit S, partial [Bacilli bacterium]|nr:type I restriction endonuclease subunit S [Bacilli bacterium]